MPAGFLARLVLVAGLARGHDADDGQFVAVVGGSLHYALGFAVDFREDALQGSHAVGAVGVVEDADVFGLDALIVAAGVGRPVDLFATGARVYGILPVFIVGLVFSGVVILGTGAVLSYSRTKEERPGAPLGGMHASKVDSVGDI